MEIIQSVFSNHSGIKLGNKNGKITRKFANTCKLNNKFPNKPQVKREILREWKKEIEFNENEFLWCRAKAVLREKFIILNEYIRKNPILIS